MKRRDVHVDQASYGIIIFVHPYNDNGELSGKMRSYEAFTGTPGHRARRTLRGMRLLSASLKQEFKLRDEL